MNNNYFEFKHVYNGEEITMRLHADNALPDLLQQFKQFLMGVGYVIDPFSSLEIVEPYEEKEEEDELIIP